MAAGEGRRETRKQFFKILMPGFSERMMIPREFSKFLAHENRMVATILSPLGRFWHVKLNLRGSDLFFSNGWKEFYQAHGFAIGWLLLFRYEGNMVFTIKVFDLSACLKNYDKSDSFRHPIMLEEESLNTNALEDDETKRPAKQPNCKEEYIECCDEVEKEEEEDDNEEEEEEEDAEEIKPKSESSSMKAKQAYTFKKIIHPYNIRYHRIGVPKDFCSVHGLDSKRKLVLKDMKGRLWPVLFCITRSSGNFFRKGWDEFSRANHVEPSDQCIFQFESKGVIRVQVVKR